MIYFTDNVNVKGRKIDEDGKLVGSAFSALNAPAKKTRLLPSTAAFSTTPQGVVGLLIALDDEGFPNGSVTVWAQRLKGDGKPVGQSKKLFTTSPDERIEASRLFALPTQPGESAARFVWYAQNSDYINSKHEVLKFDLSLP